MTSRRMTNDEAWKNVKTCIPSLIYGFVILILVTPSSSTVITVETKQVAGSGDFTINITCVPSQPMKAWEFHITTALIIKKVSLGGFFQDYQVFSVLTNPCYALTLGPGNMTREPGVLARLVLSADEPGVYPITLTGAGVTNDTMYLPLTVENGTARWDTWETITSLRIALMFLCHKNMDGGGRRW